MDVRQSRLSIRAAGLGVALAVAGIASGCAVVQEKTIGESLDDTTTGTQIETLLLTSGGVKKFGEVDVEVADRLVLLAGRVPSEADRQEAERIAWSVGAVDEVANELMIVERDIGRDVNDNWIAARIRARVLADGQVKGVNYNIHVFNGVVYLLGFAESEDELRRAAEHASVVKGVKKVISYVKLRDRIVPPTIQQGTPASSPAPYPAEETQAPAPIEAPQRMPTQRSAYSDPYADDATPPPARSNNDIESAPLELPTPEFN